LPSCADPGLHGDLNLQVVDFDLQVVDLGHRDVDEHVGPRLDLARVDERIVLVVRAVLPRPRLLLAALLVALTALVGLGVGHRPVSPS
jgi:hypothetical protein